MWRTHFFHIEFKGSHKQPHPQNLGAAAVQDRIQNRIGVERLRTFFGFCTLTGGWVRARDYASLAFLVHDLYVGPRVIKSGLPKLAVHHFWRF